MAKAVTCNVPSRMSHHIGSSLVRSFLVLAFRGRSNTIEYTLTLSIV